MFNKNIYKNVYGSFIYYSPQVGKKTSINTRTDKLWNSHRMKIPHNGKNDWTTITQKNMDEFHKHNDEWKKPDTKGNSDLSDLFHL